MKISCDWKRKGDKVRPYCMEFNSEIQFKDFFVEFLECDQTIEILELRIWKMTN